MFCIIHGLNNTHRLISCINASIIHAVDTDASEPATAKGKHISDYLKQLFACFISAELILKLDTEDVHQNYIKKAKQNMVL